MKPLLAHFVISFLFFANISFGQGWSWATNKAGYSGATHANCVIGDISGNAIVAGETYLGKYNSLGVPLWFKDPTSGFGGNALSVCTDPGGNIFVAGYFTSNITFGSTTLTNMGSDDIFIAKYDPSGNFLWAKSAGGSGMDDAYTLACDQLGNAILAGGFSSSSITFGTTTLSNSSTSMFLVKYDASGTVVWAKNQSCTGSPSSCRASSVRVDNSNNILVAGNINGNTTFGSSALSSSIYPEPFIAKYDAAGTALWGNQGSGDYYDGASKIVTDASGNSYVVGNFTGTNISFGSTTLSNTGSAMDIFIVSYDPSGMLRWAKKAGGTGTDEIASLTVNAAGIYLVGSFSGATASFGSFSVTNASNGMWDLFVAKYDLNGNAQWAIRAGNSDDDAAYDISPASTGYFYVTGTFKSSSIQFGMNNLGYSGGFNPDIFLAKLDILANDVSYLSRPQSPPAIYPNPALSEIFIESCTAIKEVRIMNMCGQVVLERNGFANNMQIDIRELCSGIYYVIIDGGELNAFVKE